jgi:hypothetical protein
MSDHFVPPPRGGLLGQWDQFVGPGATRGENLGTLSSAALGLLVAARTTQPDRLRRHIALLLAADLFGGVWANATPAATRWYHRPGQGVRQHLLFSAAHLHPFVVAWLYRDREWRFAVGNYAYLLAATAAVGLTPRQGRHAIALALWVGALWLNTARWRPTTGLRWFAPVFFFKLLVSHAAGGVRR